MTNICLKVKIDNSKEKFGSKATIADLANNCVTLMQKVETRSDFESIYSEFIQEWKFELDYAHYFDDVKFSVMFKDGSSVSAETVLM